MSDEALLSLNSASGELMVVVGLLMFAISPVPLAFPEYPELAKEALTKIANLPLLFEGVVNLILGLARVLSNLPLVGGIFRFSLQHPESGFFSICFIFTGMYMLSWAQESIRQVPPKN